MTQPGTEILAFINARLDEDEWIAQAAIRVYQAEWTPVGLQSQFDARVDDHIARHDPKRTLAEVKCKRRILAEVPCTDLGRDGYCRTAKLLALPYADHPDYRDEWRPEP